MKRYPEPIVGAFIFNQKGELFLMKSHKWKNQYTIPGGHIELGETMETALIREVKEETGMDIYGSKFICVWDFISEEEFYKKKHMIFINYLTHTKSTDIVLNDEAEEYIWITPKKALELPMGRHTRLTIQNYILKNKLVERQVLTFSTPRSFMKSFNT